MLLSKKKRRAPPQVAIARISSNQAGHRIRSRCTSFMVRYQNKCSARFIRKMYSKCVAKSLLCAHKLK